MATKRIRKVAVIGAGVMGRGIAAHLANARIPVYLLDIVPPNPSEGDDVSSKAFRNKFASAAVETLKKERPSPIYSKKDLDLITPGNTEDDLGLLADVDWVIEVVPEDLKIKKATFDKIEANANKDAIISSNTSGLSIKSMLEGRSDDFKKRFLVTHFFNPVRYMKLLELVEGEDTDPEVTKTIVRFGTDVIGKGIVFGKDTTNFVANRIGTYAMNKVMKEMDRYELSVTDVDQIFGKPMGRPKSAVFRTADLVGIDTLIHVAKNCYDTLTDDDEREVFDVPAYLHTMVEKGLKGAKTKKGFYTKTKEGLQEIDPKTLEYRPSEKSKFDSLKSAKGSPDKRIRSIVVDGEDKAAEFAREITLYSLAYSAKRLGEIADDVVNIDRALRWGFNWDLGPFETWDALGLEWTKGEFEKLGIELPAWFGEMLDKGVTSFYRWEGAKQEYYSPLDHKWHDVPVDPKAFSFDVLKKSNSPVLENFGASLWDIGDGVAMLEFHTKMNAVDDDIISMMHQSIDKVEEEFEGLVIANGADNFSAGANLFVMLMGARAGEWDAIEKTVKDFQDANQRMRFSSKPVVAAPCGLTLGGGAEIAMGANEIQAAGELYMGLVEVGVGLIPGGGGNLALLRNLFGRYSDDKEIVDPMLFIQKVIMNVAMAKVATSAEEAIEAGFLNLRDGVTINRDHVVKAAKERVLGMARAGFRPPRPMKFRLPGLSGVASVDSLLYSFVQTNQASEHDRLIGQKLAYVVCGGETSPASLVTEQHLLDLEREAFLSLCGEEKSQDRMEYMLQKNKPLRN